MAEYKQKKGQSDILWDNVTTAMSQMSLSERARLDAMIEQHGDPALRVYLSGAVSARGAVPQPIERRRRDLPAVWTQIHVLDRMEEAYSVLAAIPMATRPKAYGNGMPSVTQETRLSLLDQVLMQESGDLQALQEERNRVRLAPTSGQISRMDQALRWQFDYLRDLPEVSRSLGLKALWSASGADIGRRCAARAINPKFFNRQWQHGLTVIVWRLLRDKVPVS